MNNFNSDQDRQISIAIIKIVFESYFYIILNSTKFWKKIRKMRLSLFSARNLLLIFLYVVVNESLFTKANRDGTTSLHLLKNLSSTRLSQLDLSNQKKIELPPKKEEYSKYRKLYSKNGLIQQRKDHLQSFLHQKAGSLATSQEISATPVDNITSGGVETYSSAVKKTVLAVGAAIAFGCGVWFYRGKESALEFFAGYLIEESLSIDNIFVFIMLFDYFKVPTNFQPRALTWGIIGALVMRGGMILLGVKAIQRFQWVTLGFAGILIASSVKILMESDEEEENGDNMITNWTKKLFPAVDYFDEQKFFTQPGGKGTKTFATPLFLCLVCIELSDFVFAVDSIPAVLGVSKDPLIVYSSNIFAIIALRSLYTLVASAMTSLHYIKPSVALVLGFVGIKMILEYLHIEVSIGASLSVVIGILATGIIASLIKQKQLMKEAENQENVTL